MQKREKEVFHNELVWNTRNSGTFSARNLIVMCLSYYIPGEITRFEITRYGRKVTHSKQSRPSWSLILIDFKVMLPGVSMKYDVEMCVVSECLRAYVSESCRGLMMNGRIRMRRPRYEQGISHGVWDRKERLG
jgi:hypothetical protein